MIKVLLADDHDIVRAGLRRIVEESGDREVRVLPGRASGQTNREIAEACAISIKTVNTYRDRLLKKLNLGNNTELALFAVQNKLIDL
jgi:DNA-binding NarL/FixJ family response regulator